MAFFITINVNGLRDPVKRSSFCHWLSCLGPDVVCIQELHCVSEVEVGSWFPSFSVGSVRGDECLVVWLFFSSHLSP